MSTSGTQPPSSVRNRTMMDALDSTVLPALSLAKAGVTGIGLPGVEPIVNSVLELGKMALTMKENKEDLSRLEKRLKDLIAIDASAANEDLKRQLVELSGNLTPIAVECKSLAEKRGIKQFFKSKEYKEKIQGIKNLIALHIREFTFYGNISIQKTVEDMRWNGIDETGTIHTLASQTHLMQIRHIALNVSALIELIWRPSFGRILAECCRLGSSGSG
ncbi:hypothetical protein B0H16DRAFT_1577600 [Mycena metata]|uniref:Uncharacterized protein n=1 Tax=Mycena metata TaxID=1033252 RepID=A0AAD7MX55_9AGAR|nr:hypothetical protein B0H16DRAFT_1577600 [Mycena metata]